MAVQQADPEAMQLFQIIGAPLLAVIQAEVQAAQVSADFIRRVGFEPPRGPVEQPPAAPGTGAAAGPGPAGDVRNPEKPGKERTLQDGGDMGGLKIAEFAINRQDASGNSHPYVIRVPVLSLYPIPLLQVKDAEFDYNIRILSRAPLESDDRRDVQTDYTPSQDYLAPDRLELKGMLAPSGGQGGHSSSMSMKVKIRMEQSDIPVGLSKLLSIMDQNITSTPAPKKPGD